MKKRMEKLGMDKDRLRLAWVSAAEGAKFASIIQEMAANLSKLTPGQISRDAEKLQEFLNKKSAVK
jgi:coenzyme F420-reducing hydrogenase delta subunit